MKQLWLHLWNNRHCSVCGTSFYLKAEPSEFACGEIEGHPQYLVLQNWRSFLLQPFLWHDPWSGRKGVVEEPAANSLKNTLLRELHDKKASPFRSLLKSNLHWLTRCGTTFWYRQITWRIMVLSTITSTVSTTARHKKKTKKQNSQSCLCCP